MDEKALTFAVKKLFINKEVDSVVFQKGNKYGKGRPPGFFMTDKTAAIKIIFKIFNENRHLFEEKMQAKMLADPIMFYERFVAPLQPRDFTLELGDETQKAFSKLFSHLKPNNNG